MRQRRTLLFVEREHDYVRGWTSQSHTQFAYDNTLTQTGYHDISQVAYFGLEVCVFSTFPNAGHNIMFPQVLFQNRLLLKQCSSKRRYLLIFDTQITNSSLEVLKGPAVEQK